MSRKQLSVITLLLLTAVTLTGCALTGGPARKKGLVLGEIPYTTIAIPSAEFDALNEGEFAVWYEENSRTAGIHSFTAGENRYLLLAAGEKPTAGYYLEAIVLTGTETEIAAAAALHRPGEEESVAQVITYPNALLCIPADGRDAVLTGITGNNGDETPERTDTGRYAGQIDSNSIEIMISGVPAENAARAFRLSEALKAGFAGLNLAEGDEIRFTYQDRNIGQPVITQIEKIQPQNE
ncbi:MAG: protease complex subunit PrcB family protein [bacterium]|jgi:hypothetical protein